MCSSTGYGDARADLHGLYNATLLFYHDNGQYPITDDKSTWYEKLVAGNYVDVISTTADGRLPVDEAYGNSFVYEPPPPISSTTARPILRWVGINGIDEHGKADDIDIRFGINAGYYHKSGYPAARVTAIAGIIILIIGFVILWRLIHSTPLRIGIALSASGILAVLVGSIGNDPFCHGCDGLYEILSNIGVPIILLSIMPFSVMFMNCVKKQHQGVSNQCRDCGYDLRGSDSARCPECGALRTAARDKPRR